MEWQVYKYNIGIAIMTVLAGYVAITFLCLASKRQVLEMMAWYGIMTTPLFYFGMAQLGPSTLRKFVPELEEKFKVVQYESAMRWRSIQELPQDEATEPATLLFQDDEGMTRRIAGYSIREWVRVAKEIKKYNYRIRARALGTDYEQAVQMFGDNPYCCEQGGGTYHMTEYGEWVVNYLATLPPLRVCKFRHSVFRRLSHTYTHAGEVV